MNDTPTTNPSDVDSNPVADDTPDRPVSFEMSLYELVMLQHALQTVVAWNRAEGDDYLANEYNSLRKRLIDAHETHLDPDQ